MESLYQIGTEDVNNKDLTPFFTNLALGQAPKAALHGDRAASGGP
jgi:hypothetical protein